jgi:hypothetical protein
MGLTTWASSPSGRIVKSDVHVAKNYLAETEIDDLGRIVNAYLDLAESRAKRKVPMTMDDCVTKWGRFLFVLKSPRTKRDKIEPSPFCRADPLKSLIGTKSTPAGDGNAYNIIKFHVSCCYLLGRYKK